MKPAPVFALVLSCSVFGAGCSGGGGGGSVARGVAASTPDGQADSGTAQPSEPPPAPLTISPRSLPTAQLGVAYSATLVVSGTEPIAWSVSGALPPGISLGATGCHVNRLFGIASVAGSYSFTLQVTDATGATGTTSYSIGVPAPAPTPVGVPVPSPCPSPIASPGPTPKPSPGPSPSPSASPSPAPSASPSPSPTPTPTPSSPATFDPADGSTLPAATVGHHYIQTIGVTGASPFIVFDGAFTFPPGLAAQLSGSSSTFYIVGTPTTAGTYKVVIGVAQSTVTYSLTVQPRLFTLDPPDGAVIPDATVASVYSQTFTVSGGTAPCTFAPTGLPSGLAVTTISGNAFAITGTPTANQAYFASFSIQVTDSTGATESEPYYISIDTPWYVSPLKLATGKVGQSYAQTLKLQGGTGAVQWSVGGWLPPGLSLDSSGNLTGTCQQGGSFSFNVTGTDSVGNSAVQSYTLDVLVGGPLTLSPTSLGDGAAGSYYSQSFTANGAGTLTWSVSGGTLPDGLALDSSGNLTGGATTSGTSSFTLSVTDSFGQSGSQDYVLTID